MSRFFRKQLTHWKLGALLVVLSGLLVLTAHWAWSLSYKKDKASTGLASVAKRNEYLTQRVKVLEERNNFLHTTTGQRDYLVNRHAMIQEGERVLILVRDDRQPGAQVEDSEEEKTPWWRWW